MKHHVEMFPPDGGDSEQVYTGAIPHLLAEGWTRQRMIAKPVKEVKKAAPKKAKKKAG